MDKIRIITISREFGSGGRSIAKAVAENLNIPYYDKELIKHVAEKTGFDPKYIEEHGESTRSKWSFLLSSGLTTAAMGGMSASDFLWVMQRQVILELAEKGPCVILGRCADYILKDRKDCLNAFIHASQEFKAERIVRMYGESEVNPSERLKEKDNRRRNNYNLYTGRVWGDSRNYTISLDSSAIGVDKCAGIITELAK